MAANVGEPIPRPGARGGRWVTIGESRLWSGSYRCSVAHSTTPQTGRDAGPWLACKFSLLGGVEITGMFGALVATDGLRIHRGVGLRVAYCVPAGVRLPDHSWVGHGQIRPVARGRQLAACALPNGIGRGLVGSPRFALDEPPARENHHIVHLGFFQALNPVRLLVFCGCIYWPTREKRFAVGRLSTGTPENSLLPNPLQARLWIG